MSIKRVLFHSISTANNAKRGGRATREAREDAGRQFSEFCRASGFQLRDIGKIEASWLTAWVTQLKASGISTGTVNNKVSHVRALAKSAGQNLEVTGLKDSAALGLDIRCRRGTKTPVTDEVFNSAVQQALALGEVGFAHAIKLERFLGLRGLEALMSTHALAEFAKEARLLMDPHLVEIHLTDGTKGGRPRRSAVILKYAAETFQAVFEALDYARKNGGFLINGAPKTGLAGARRTYHRIAAKVGLVGTFAPHSLRYRYCVDKLTELREAGVPRNEALALASQWLGHSGSRVRFVTLVYGTAVTKSYPKTSRLDNIRNVVAELNDLVKSIQPRD